MAMIVKKCGCDCSTQTSACGCGGGITLSCRTRGGFAHVVGFDELTSPSTPPKKYLNYVFSGTGNTEGHNAPDCSDANNCFDVGTNSGQRTYNPTAGTITDTGLHTVVGSCSPGTTAIIDITANPGEGDVVVVTRTEKTITNSLACWSAGGIYQKRTAVPTYKAELQNEYTEDQAKTDLMAGTSGTWSPWDSTGTQSCSAEYQLRTTGFSFVYQEAQWKVNGTGLVSGHTYQIMIHTVRAPFGSGTFVPYSTIVTTATADSAGNFEVSGDIPNDQGFTTAAINSEVSS